MPRSVNHVASRARRKNFMKLAKGYFGRRKNVWTVAKNAIEKGLNYAYEGRKQKKRNFRSLLSRHSVQRGVGGRLMNSWRSSIVLNRNTKLILIEFM